MKLSRGRPYTIVSAVALMAIDSCHPVTLTSGPASADTSRTASPSASASDPPAAVCASPCGGPGAWVQGWLDARRDLALWEIVDSPACHHIAGEFFDRHGAVELTMPRPFLGPGTPGEASALRNRHDAHVAGLTRGPSFACPP